MTIAFFSNVLNIHQLPVADELYELCNHRYRFVSFGKTNEETLKGGADVNVDRPYHIIAGESMDSQSMIRDIALNADILVYGLAPDNLIKERIKNNKITILYTERWLKRGILNIISPILLKRFLSYHTTKDKSNMYCLCANAYAKDDFKRLGMYENKCFKWGYFTKPISRDFSKHKFDKPASALKILWVARFLKLKHPERMLQLGSYLKGRGLENFSITMVGDGSEMAFIKEQIDKLGLTDYVKLTGAIPNSKVLEQMCEHDVFCFTSDRNEGWGAVLNEAMSCGCCPIASVEIGATPYLIKDRYNGLVYDPKTRNDLEEKIVWLMDHPKEMKEMGARAADTLQNVWSPKNAAKQFYQLCKNFIEHKESNIVDGPCSKA